MITAIIYLALAIVSFAIAVYKVRKAENELYN